MTFFTVRPHLASEDVVAGIYAKLSPVQQNAATNWQMSSLGDGHNSGRRPPRHHFVGQVWPCEHADTITVIGSEQLQEDLCGSKGACSVRSLW